MSVTGPGNIGGLNQAAAFAGTQRTEADTDRLKAAAAEQKFQVERQAGRGALEGAELSPDRDADGRLPPDAPPERRDDSDDEEQPDSARRPPDALGERGTVLDLEA